MQGSRVLVVDDDPGIRAVLRGYLERDGYAVSEAGDATTALAATASAHPPHAVLLDIGLPDLDGLEVLRRIRASSDMAVLVVSARVEEVDRLVGLGMGADDYISKPFSPREVVARVGVVLRRVGRTTSASAAAERLGAGDLVADLGAREVRSRGETVELTALEFDLLVTLMRHPGRVLTRRQIIEQVWGGDFFGDERVVDVHIRSLRARLGDDASSPRAIATVRGVGYKFVGADA